MMMTKNLRTTICWEQSHSANFGPNSLNYPGSKKSFFTVLETMKQALPVRQKNC